MLQRYRERWFQVNLPLADVKYFNVSLGDYLSTRRLRVSTDHEERGLPLMI